MQHVNSMPYSSWSNAREAPLEGALFIYACVLTLWYSRGRTLVMNFVTNKLDQPALALPKTWGVQQRISFSMAMTLLMFELIILWKLLNPLELLVVDPTLDPRPISERSGILKRF